MMENRARICTAIALVLVVSVLAPGELCTGRRLGADDFEAAIMALQRSLQNERSQPQRYGVAVDAGALHRHLQRRQNAFWRKRSDLGNPV